ncbi:MAG: sensor histidine kinase, partial [Bacteroidota bacterium]
LEKENTRVQLAILRNQISPHFFMNTLNNIYALIDTDTRKSKESVMKLSKLMRYLLYENSNGKVKLSREFEFIKSYVDLMIIRFDNDIIVNLEIPENYADIEIPVMIFISYIENAFKFGASYQQKSFIHVVFEVTDNMLFFTCLNSITRKKEVNRVGGLGLSNSKQRLDLLFKDRYKLSVRETEKIFTVELNIPLT